MIVIKNGFLSKYYSSFLQSEKTQPKPQSVAAPSIDRFFIRKTPFFKRMMDILLAIICLTIFSPALIAIAIAIKMTSKGPVLFKQDRVGEGGKIFEFLKFRGSTGMGVVNSYNFS